MALFKVLRGSSTALANQPFHDGYAYFTPDDGRFYIDVQLDTAPDYYFDNGIEGGKNVYRIEIESKTWSLLSSRIDERAALGHQHTIPEVGALQGILTTGTGSFVSSGSTINIDLQADWAQTDSTKANFIKNKPTIINVAITVDDNAKTLFITSPVTNGDGVSY